MDTEDNMHVLTNNIHRDKAVIVSIALFVSRNTRNVLEILKASNVMKKSPESGNGNNSRCPVIPSLPKK